MGSSFGIARREPAAASARQKRRVIKQFARSFPVLVAGFLVTVTSGVLAVVMGLAGPSTSILFVSWLFAPAPVVLMFLMLRKFSNRLRAVLRIYIFMSVLSTGLLLLAVGWSGSETALHPKPCEDMEELSEYPHLESATQKVSFTASDGTRLEGWVALGTSDAVVLLLHGYRCDKRSMLLRASMIFDAGMTVFLFDFRNTGESGGDFTSFGYYEKLDLAAALDLLEILDTDDDGGRLTLNNVGLLGLSNGGATAILYTAENPERIDALIVDSSFKSLDSAVSQSFTHFVGLPAFPFAPITVWITEMRTGISRKAIIPEKSVQQLIDTPMLVIHGLDDAVISYKDSESIFNNGSEPKEFWLVPDAEHGNASEIAGAEYREKVVGFLSRYLIE
jgi:pimeloyl-ACP methyl ester carboxylesterase